MIENEWTEETGGRNKIRKREIMKERKRKEWKRGWMDGEKEKWSGGSTTSRDRGET